MRNTKGITLIALIITIIVLLILAGVSINLIVGENGILKQASDAVNIYKQKENEESGEFDNLYNEFENYINDLTKKDDNNSDRVDSTSSLWDFDPATGTLGCYNGTPEQLFGDSDTVKIPSHIDGIEVKIIRGNGPIFYKCEMGILNKKLKLPTTVQTIGYNAFYNSYQGRPTFVGELVIPNSVKTIGAYAFQGAKLSSVNIISATSIGEYAFASCSYLSNVTLPNTLTTIEYATFSRTKLTQVYIPDSVTLIKNSAFGDCTSLTSVSIPASTTVAEAAFERINPTITRR